MATRFNADYVLTDHDKKLIASGICDEDYIRIARMSSKQMIEEGYATVTAVCVKHCEEDCNECN